MAVVSFWSNGKQEVGKSVSIAAIATYMGINSNYKILVLNTLRNDPTLEDCFWPSVETGIKFKDKTKQDIATGLSGLTQAILSNKISPEIITNYTRIVFKNKLEILTDKDTSREDYIKQRNLFRDIIKMANKYYDLVFVDINGEIEDKHVFPILEESNILAVAIPQTTRGINEYLELRKEKGILSNERKIVMVGRQDMKSTFNAKNIARSIGEKAVYGIPYNTQFFESCNQGQVAEYFIKFRKIKPTDPNSPFIESVKNASMGLLEKIKLIQTQMYR